MTKIVAIANITPDSFSGDGIVTSSSQDNADVQVSESKAVEYIAALIDAGADVIDIGAESTRPDATPLSADEEWSRLESVLPPVIKLAHDNNVEISLDSFHADTVRKALAMGVDWINDVSGFQDEAMVEAIKDSNCKIVIMHSMGVPPRKDVHIDVNVDPIEYISAWFEENITRLNREGIECNRMVIDPGIGFGKTSEQSVIIIRRTKELQRRFNLPVYIGHSRKSYLQLFTDKPPNQRDNLTAFFSVMMMKNGVDYLRVHDVQSHVLLRRNIEASEFVA